MGGRRGVRADVCLVLSWLSASTVILLTRGAVAAPCSGTSPVYMSNTDGDGESDACDACPLSPASMPLSPRDPGCHLGTVSTKPPWLPSEFASDGSWWKAHSCVPAMAFPVVDVAGSARGLVVVGSAPADVSAVAAAIAAGNSWPSSTPARCLASIDFDTSVIAVRGFEAPALATLYAQWTRSPHVADYAPDDGLGLVTGPIISLAVREPPLGIAPTRIERLPFSRAVVYAHDLKSGGGRPCSMRTAATEEAIAWDPTLGPAPWVKSEVCTLAGSSSPLAVPADFRVVPSALDAVLLADRTTLRARMRNATPVAMLQADAIDGVPFGLFADDRFPPATTPALLASGGMLYPPADEHSWTLVPSSIAVLRQHLHYDSSDLGGASGVVTAYPPLGPATYSLRSPQGVLLAMQKFDVPQDGRVTKTVLAQTGLSGPRRVETLWPVWPPSAATNADDAQYGNRWTASGARHDCWASTADGYPTDVDQQLAYPAAGDVPVAKVWCPAELTSWKQERPEVTTDEGAGTICAPAQSAMEKFERPETVVSAVQKCAKQKAGIDSHASCCERSATCSSLTLASCPSSSCCAQLVESLADTITDVDPATFDCVVNQIFCDFAAQYPPTAHWAAADSKQHPLIPLVGLMRAEDGPAMHSHLSPTDEVAAGDHQGLDWNWEIEPVIKGDGAFAIDPLYRTIIRRDAYRQIEIEMEFLIARGLWDAGRKTPPFYDAHGATKTIDKLKLLEDLGAAWPTSEPFCLLFGFDTGPTNMALVPSRNCGGYYIDPFWRSHYGRGLFAEINTVLVPTSRASRMVLAPHWPIGSQEVYVGATASLGIAAFEDAKPHRLGMLGRPIMDCGHSPTKLELHPPHLLTMDLAPMTIGESSGVLVAVFGWANQGSPAHMEFDLWPPPRPSAHARLSVRGVNRFGEGTDPIPDGQYGWVVDVNPTNTVTAAKPRVQCVPAPSQFPNHLHCSYDDPAAGRGDPPEPAVKCDQPDATPPTAPRNARMRPHFATSRFEMRVFVGWSSRTAEPGGADVQ